MARENEALKNVKTTLNIIMSAFLAWGLIKHIWNLVLATLGIDNPYLYETTPNETVSVTYDTNFKTGKTIETKTFRKKDGTTHRHRKEI